MLPGNVTWIISLFSLLLERLGNAYLQVYWRMPYCQKVHYSEGPLVRRPVSQKKSVNSILLIHFPKHFSFTFNILNPVSFHFSHSTLTSFLALLDCVSTANAVARASVKRIYSATVKQINAKFCGKVAIRHISRHVSPF